MMRYILRHFSCHIESARGKEDPKLISRDVEAIAINVTFVKMKFSNPEAYYWDYAASPRIFTSLAYCSSFGVAGISCSIPPFLAISGSGLHLTGHIPLRRQIVRLQSDLRVPCHLDTPDNEKANRMAQPAGHTQQKICLTTWDSNFKDSGEGHRFKLFDTPVFTYCRLLGIVSSPWNRLSDNILFRLLLL